MIQLPYRRTPPKTQFRRAFEGVMDPITQTVSYLGRSYDVEELWRMLHQLITASMYKDHLTASEVRDAETAEAVAEDILAIVGYEWARLPRKALAPALRRAMLPA